MLKEHKISSIDRMRIIEEWKHGDFSSIEKYNFKELAKIKVLNDFQRTIVIYLVLFGKLDFLRENYAYINLKDHYDLDMNNVLHYCCYLNKKGMAKFFIDNFPKFKFHTVNLLGKLPIDVTNNKKSFIPIFEKKATSRIRDGGIPSCFEMISIWGNRKVTSKHQKLKTQLEIDSMDKTFLKRFKEKEAVDSLHPTKFTTAIKECDYENVEYQIVKNPVLANIRLNNGRTPLILVVQALNKCGRKKGGLFKMFESFLKLGANPYLTYNGKNALDFAALAEDRLKLEDMIKDFLVKKESDSLNVIEGLESDKD